MLGVFYRADCFPAVYARCLFLFFVTAENFFLKRQKKRQSKKNSLETPVRINDIDCEMVHSIPFRRLQTGSIIYFSLSLSFIMAITSACASKLANHSRISRIVATCPFSRCRRRITFQFEFLTRNAFWRPNSTRSPSQ